jgi:aerobic-type carbon monoxide dehydrogenase small subunit (CoxS/CutS family)
MVGVRVNGRHYERTVDDRRTAADFIREDLGLTGTHVGCEHGVCGACTILLDGQAVRSCLLFAVQLDGRAVTTIEGLAGDDGSLHPVQEAFMRACSFQCGFCTPGFLMTTIELLAELVGFDERSVREALSGNVCRCTGYESIVNGVREAWLASRPAVGGVA